MTLAFFVLTQYRRVTDRRTDRQTRCCRKDPHQHSVAPVKSKARKGLQKNIRGNTSHLTTHSPLAIHTKPWKNFFVTFSRFDTIPQCFTRQADGQTDRQTDGIAVVLYQYRHVIRIRALHTDGRPKPLNCESEDVYNVTSCVGGH